MDSQLTLFKKEIKNITSHCISGMDNTKLVHGCPYGGCGILWKSDITSDASPISINCNRLCAVSVKIKSTKFLLCTVYMPYQISGSNTRDTVQDVLHSLSYLCNNNSFDYFIIGGDINTCLSNTGQPMTRQIMSFVKDEELLCVSQMADVCKIAYTFESKANGAQSFIDHFLISPNLGKSITECALKNDIENLSDHLPVCLHLDIDHNIGF